MNVPNGISLLRILFVPVIIILMLVNISNHSIIVNGNYHLSITQLIAGILFIIASVSDFLDGYLARKLNQITIFGKFFDAIADKFLTNSVLIVMSYQAIIPIWITLILVLRDFLIDAVRQILASKQIIMSANWYGKWKAAFQMLGLTILFFVSCKNFNASNADVKMYGQYGLINQLLLIPIYIATLLSIYSAIVYIQLNYKFLLAK